MNEVSDNYLVKNHGKKWHYLCSKQSRESTQNKIGAEWGQSMVFGICLGLFKVGSQSEHNFFFFHNSIEGSHSK